MCSRTPDGASPRAIVSLLAAGDRRAGDGAPQAAHRLRRHRRRTLARPANRAEPGGIVASSGYALSGADRDAGAASRSISASCPTRRRRSAASPSARQDADLIVTLGGASVGDHDLVQKALGPNGFALDFWKIAMRPGKPLIFGKLGRTPLLGLPGNPVSTLVCAILFLRPAIAAMLGTDTAMPLLSARLSAPLAANDMRQDYIRATLELRNGEYWTEPFPVQDSSMLGTIAAASALIVRAPQAPALEAGARVDVLSLIDV